jgi:CheY-like chemotaxis protein
LREGKLLVRLSDLLEGAPEAVLRIQDDGIGIAPDMLHSIFDLFVQVDHSTTRSQGGLGIGLTLVRNLVEMHKGTVEARSAGLGHGSEFIVSLPLAAPISAQQSNVTPAEENQTAAPSGHRIIVVDDNRDAAETLAVVLRLEGHTVATAHDGHTALELAKSWQPELVLLDLGMPGMDGFEVARRLREQPGLEKVVLAALTGWGQQADRQRTAAAGFDHHLVKPVDMNMLMELLAGMAEA